MIALRTVLAVVLAAVVVRVRNATAVARLATLRVHALRHPEVVQEAMVVVGGEEGTVPLVAVAVAAVVVVVVKKLGARSLYLVASPPAANTLFEVTRAEG